MHSALAPIDVSPLISCVAVVSSFLITNTFPSGSGGQLEDVKILANSFMQMPLVVAYRTGAEQTESEIAVLFLLSLLSDEIYGKQNVY